MNTHQTIAEAREANIETGAVAIAEIEHVTIGHCYIGIKANFDTFQRAMRSKGHPEITAIIAGHDIRASQPIVRHCDRCGAVVPETAYHQQEWTRFGGQKVRVTAWYCEGCRQVLQSIGQGEYSAMQERANDIPSYEPAYKAD